LLFISQKIKLLYFVNFSGSKIVLENVHSLNLNKNLVHEPKKTIILLIKHLLY